MLTYRYSCRQDNGDRSRTRIIQNPSYDYTSCNRELASVDIELRSGSENSARSSLVTDHTSSWKHQSEDFTKRSLPRYSIDDAHDLLAQSCLTLLNRRKRECSFFSIFSILYGDRLPDFCDGESTLMDYAAAHWSIHYSVAEKRSMRLPGLLQRCLRIALASAYEKLSIFEDRRCNQISQSILRVCAFYGFKSLTQMYLKMGTSPDGDSCSYCDSPLRLAAAGGHLETIAVLFQEGASANAHTGINGEKLLYLAATYGNVAIAKLLLEHGLTADVGYDATRQSHTSEDAAVNKDTYRHVKLAPDNQGMTPMHAAAALGYVEFIKVLMCHNLDTNAELPVTKETPLHLAAAHGHLKAVWQLTDGRDPSKKEMDVYDLIVQQSYHQSWTDEMLEGKGAIGAFVWEYDARCSAEEDMKKLISCSGSYADVRLRDYRGRTPLHLAASNGKEAIVRFLHGRGAAIEMRDNAGYSALQLAARNGHLGVVKQLLEAGAKTQTGAENWGLVFEQTANEKHYSIENLILWSSYSEQLASERPALSLATKSQSNPVQEALCRKRAQGGKQKRWSLSRLPLHLHNN